MTEKYIFKGQTTFINRPKDTVIRDFQNQYIAGEESGKDSINSNIARLLEDTPQCCRTRCQKESKSSYDPRHTICDK